MVVIKIRSAVIKRSNEQTNVSENSSAKIGLYHLKSRPCFFFILLIYFKASIFIPFKFKPFQIYRKF